MFCFNLNFLCMYYSSIHADHQFSQLVAGLDYKSSFLLAIVKHVFFSVHAVSMTVQILVMILKKRLIRRHWKGKITKKTM